jgi:hypothetical protein
MNNKFLNVQKSISELMEDVRQETIKEMEEKYQSSNKSQAEEQEKRMLYTTDEALKMLGKKSVNTLKDWVDKGYLNPPKKIGRFNYYDANDIVRLLENGTRN